MSFQKAICFFSSLCHCNRAECWTWYPNGRWFPLFIWFMNQMQTPGQSLRRNSIYSAASWRALFSVPCMWGDVIAGCASAHLGFEALWVLAKENIMGIKTLKAEALSPHIWEQDWRWVCVIACVDYTERSKPRPHPTWPYRTLPLPHTYTPHIAAPIAAVWNALNSEYITVY